MERVLRARGPFAFELALRYLATSPSTIAERIDTAAGIYRRAFRAADGDIAIAEVTQAPDGLRVNVRCHPERSEGSASPRDLAQSDLDLACAIAASAFGLDGDPTGVDDVAERDPTIAPLLRRCRGLRPLQVPDPFEALVWAILGQQINVAFAAKTKRALIEAYGTRLRDGLWLFPSPERLAGTSPDELRPLQISRQKAQYIGELARARVDFDRIRALDGDAVVEELTRLKGIGRWTAEYLLLRGFGRPDAIPAGDMGLRAVVGRLYGKGRNASELEVREVAEAWRPWRGHVAFMMWFGLQQKEL